MIFLFNSTRNSIKGNANKVSRTAMEATFYKQRLFQLAFKYEIWLTKNEVLRNWVPEILVLGTERWNSLFRNLIYYIFSQAPATASFPEPDNLVMIRTLAQIDFSIMYIRLSLQIGHVLSGYQNFFIHFAYLAYVLNVPTSVASSLTS
jgi:hypothetical protein